MSVTIYGIRNCDTMKKARAWLNHRNVSYSFHDYKTAGITRERLKLWSSAVGWEILLNRRGTTFRDLPDAERAAVDEEKALALMEARPTIIKRPVLETPSGITVGFKPEIYERVFGD